MPEIVTAPGSVLSRDLNGLFGGTYEGRRVFVTGHTGFKGSWLVLWLQSMGALVEGFALEPESTPSHHALISTGPSSGIGDIRNAGHVRDAMQQFAPEIVFHLAAQALVRRGYAEPVTTFDVNVMGLVHVLEAVRATPSVRAVVNVTTDKCYRQPSASGGAFSEGDALGGHDPYSASKACAEIISESYRQSFLSASLPDHRHVALATARAGNVIGGGDWASDRLVPDMVRAASEGRDVRIRTPHAVRPWQHVLEPLSGYLMLGQKLLQAPHHAWRYSEGWNFGPQESDHMTVAQVIDGLSAHWNAISSQTDDAQHPHEAEVLRLDCTKARRELCWWPVWDAARMLERTALWYRAWYETGTVRTAHDLADYTSDARQMGLRWAQS